jgi:hypothetical protein
MHEKIVKRFDIFGKKTHGFLLWGFANQTIGRKEGS